MMEYPLKERGVRKFFKNIQYRRCKMASFEVIGRLKISLAENLGETRGWDLSTTGSWV